MSMSIILRNALRDPNYAPYCAPCPGLVRMKKVEPFLWRCVKCGAIHDEKAEARKAQASSTDISGEQ